MKYILVIDQISHGGAERILIDYYHHLKRDGHEVTVFALSGNSEQSEWTDGVNVVYGINSNDDNLIKKTFQQIALFFRLKRIVQKEKPDVIFSFLEKSNLLTVLVSSRATKVVSVHNILSIQYTKIRSAFIRKVLYSIIGKAYNHCPNVVAVSRQVADDLITSFGVREKNIHVINNYVDRRDIEYKSGQEIDNFVFNPDIHYIMNVGRFSDQKAQWKLLKAFAVYLQNKPFSKNAQLILMGTGDYVTALKKLACDLHIENEVYFLPFNVNPYKYMAHAHLFVLSSIYEGFPIVLAEISSLRIPFVGTEKAIPAEMFSDEEVWKKYIFQSTTLTKDFSTTIHKDEQSLAQLLKKGVEDEIFRAQLLSNTQSWENNNDKSVQFGLYDAFRR